MESRLEVKLPYNHIPNKRDIGGAHLNCKSTHVHWMGDKRGLLAFNASKAVNHIKIHLPSHVQLI